MHVDPRRGAALLVLQPERGACDPFRRRIQVRRVHHDRGVFSPHLEQARLDPLAGEALVDIHPYPLPPREDDAARAPGAPPPPPPDPPRPPGIGERPPPDAPTPAPPRPLEPRPPGAFRGGS